MILVVYNLPAPEDRKQTNSFKKLLYSMLVFSARRLFAVSTLSVSFFVSQAQTVNHPSLKKETKPYKVFTSGKEITIKSSKNILNVMLWTISGHRVVEQKEINAPSCSFVIPINDKFYFLMVGLEGGKIYTEKIGIQ
jgi:hypothetical protein